jgi:hypothetical protein
MCEMRSYPMRPLPTSPLFQPSLPRWSLYRPSLPGASLAHSQLTPAHAIGVLSAALARCGNNTAGRRRAPQSVRRGVRRAAPRRPPGPAQCAKRAATLCTRPGHRALSLRCLPPRSLAPPSPAQIGAGHGGLSRAHASCVGNTRSCIACASPPRRRATADGIEMRSPCRTGCGGVRPNCATAPDPFIAGTSPRRGEIATWGSPRRRLVSGRSEARDPAANRRSR